MQPVMPLVGLILGIGLLPEVVFCVGADGHRAVELVGLACCHTDTENDDCASRDDHCSSHCSDLDFATHAMASKSSTQHLADDITGIAPIAATSWIPAPYAAGTVAGRISAPAFFLPPPRERHTTVLLC